MSEILDVSYDEDGEIAQFLVLGDDGVPDPKVPSPENLLLYDPEDDLPFDGGMNDFLSGDSALQIDDDPEILVSQAGDEYSYVLSIDGNPVETTPTQASTLLKGVYQALANDDLAELERLYDRIMASQVRRRLVNALKHTFDESSRIEVTDSGWLVDEYYLVDWNAKMYYADEDPDEPDYVRSSGGVEKDTTYEIVKLKHSLGSVEPQTVAISGDKYELTEREMLFLAKITWLLDRRFFHPDNAFWQYTDEWANMDIDTDTDTFNL